MAPLISILYTRDTTGVFNQWMRSERCECRLRSHRTPRLDFGDTSETNTRSEVYSSDNRKPTKPFSTITILTANESLNTCKQFVSPETTKSAARKNRRLINSIQIRVNFVRKCQFFRKENWIETCAVFILDTIHCHVVAFLQIRWRAQ